MSAEPEVDLPEGLVLIIATAYRQAVAVRDQDCAEGHPGIGAGILAEYLAKGLEWAVQYQAWRDGQWAEHPGSVQETLDRYLRGD